MTVGTSRPQVAPLGSSEALLGTNPMSLGFPASPDVIVWDATTAALSQGELGAHQRNNTALPEGVGFDRDGNATRDAAAVAQGGALRAFGGRRGGGSGSTPSGRWSSGCRASYPAKVSMS